MGTRIIRVRNELGERLSRPGGINRDKAVAEAGKRVETLRIPCEEAITHDIACLEKIVAEAGAEIGARGLEQALDAAARLLTLSGTFGFPLLDAVAERFCDLCSGMQERAITVTAPLRVHISAMRLVWKTGLDGAQAALILDELSRIHAYYGLEPHKTDAP
jgi:hypothetical protein